MPLEAKEWHVPCGWCVTQRHDQCKPRIEHKEQKAVSICTCQHESHSKTLAAGEAEQ